MPGDILISGSGGFLGVVVPEAALGMAPGDNMTARSVTLVPEPGSMAAVINMGVFVLVRRKRSV